MIDRRSLGGAAGFGALRSASEVGAALRNLACLLLVTYHVIGSGPGAGLKIAYPHSLRIFADLLIDVRMPLFAFVAGLVYALRPPDFRGLVPFAVGKVRRLLVPGAVAALAFASLSTAIGSSFAVEPERLWKVLAYPYAHYWFLQAIFTIILAVSVADAITRGRAILPLLAGAVALNLADWKIPSMVFALYQVVYLLPYYVLGIVVVRFRQQLLGAALPIGVVCAVCLAAGLAMNVEHFDRLGILSNSRQDLQSLLTGLSICLIAFLVASVLRIATPLALMGPYTFTIYLYHVFGTSAARRLMDGIGVTDEASLLVAGITCGLLLPVALHLVAERHAVTRALILGQRS